ncbi:SDR family NAD(P)-dependent oxidoreductase [Enterovirga aerilata]|uniref:SDR family oxidoreductase n=1 Tax=Enterovirga aerilata TaxID=2730920 RepID=A0A849IDP5_9HYPH|nr:SDR family NAD(P)-dependent oxidoreductase [Enterovirga sp. DB1703]NNM74559.1 SDR family oxidoreductase [Enterovirga sp. DB1703]
MYGLEGRRAIVTGAAYGIGKGIASRLAAEGCDVGLFDLDLAAAERVAVELSGSGRRVAVAAGDVSSKTDVEAGIGRLLAELGGGADILVNNAGICRIGKLLEMSESDWRATFGINVDGLFYASRMVVPGMVERRSGAVINLASWMGKSGAEAYGAYCASKFAVVALTQTLALEVGEHGVRVNAVAPGLVVQTKMRDESEERRRREGLPLAEERAKAIPLRRAAVPEDIAKAVAFLASDEAAYITGETLSVTGGVWND